MKPRPVLLTEIPHDAHEGLDTCEASRMVAAFAEDPARAVGAVARLRSCS